MKKIKLIKQHDEKDCGVACLSMILNFYDTSVPISKLRLMAGTNSQGTSALGLVQALNNFHFQTQVIQTDESIWKEEDVNYPLIAHVIIDGVFFHYVVVYGMKNGKLLLADPAKGKIKQTPKEFASIWTGILLITVPTENYHPTQDKSNGLFSFVSLLANHKKTIAGIVLLSFILTGFGIIGSYYFQVIIDRIVPLRSVNLLEIISIGLLSMYVIQTLFQYFKQYLLIRLGQQLSSSIMLKYFNHVLNLPMNFFSTRKSGEIISRFLDANKIIDALANVTLSLFLDVSMVIFIGTALFLQNYLLFYISLSTLPIYGLIVFLFMKPFDRTNEEQMESSAVVNSQIIESLKGIETIKSFNATNLVYEKVQQQFKEMMDKSFKNTNLDNLQSNLKTALQVISSTTLLWVGTYLVIKGRLSIGQLITYNALMSFFITPLQNIINLQVKIQTAKVANDRLNEIFLLDREFLGEATNQQMSNIELGTKEPLIEVKDLSFAYGFEENVLNNLSFSINSNEKVAIVGMSGSGKSTLAKLFVNFYTAQKGEIEIQGKSIQNISRFDLRNKIGYVSQENFFFSGSIFENLIFGLDYQPTEEQILWACEMAQIKEYIEGLPLQFQSPIEEGASNLSGGQRQRLALARALLKNSEILILDEITSGLDSRSEHLIIQNLMNLENKTILFIAHHLSIAKDCDHVFVLDKGRLVESGTHTQLRALHGTYEELWKMMTIA
ncbi:peptide cleavage/export ABC transporter [Lactobacillus mulieris]|uniref:peptide cleavage/export ABC transporter n=1 Tax=Lactobacillus mulieris TaxID=2508708 RepID=UPI001432D03A|nr:peptide cleavage/export ABC transporter [Lactobacillus mulieris]MDK6804013.1 peptide cleavage/export ABC transporter [Lactobacillus mulieris]MDK8383146.1 peptide cleavage/export ABC transporter [Lactobacillus mulieris]MDT9621349.1 peptide cleavage/export ABC transporter [Lactobacillus mulieris]NKC42301.1 peptide cleavage/export ABC transporter [Lactobacillus mulieris]